MLIIPSIEIQNGICCHCISGEPGTENLYQDFQKSPVELSKLLRRENFKALHLIDRDSILYGKDLNYDLISELCKGLDIPVQLHADFKSLDECESALQSGVYRLIISNELMMNEDFIDEFRAKHSMSKLIFAIIINENGEFLINNSNHTFAINTIISMIKKIGSNRLIIGSERSNETGEKIDYRYFIEILKNKSIRTTLYGGISSPFDLWELSKSDNYNIDSIIIGTPLLNNKFPCQKIWRMIEADLENIKK